jgi:hypothetical protein
MNLRGPSSLLLAGQFRIKRTCILFLNQNKEHKIDSASVLVSQNAMPIFGTT